MILVTIATTAVDKAKVGTRGLLLAVSRGIVNSLPPTSGVKEDRAVGPPNAWGISSTRVIGDIYPDVDTW